jgi:low temperature requirement protein LtrA
LVIVDTNRMDDPHHRTHLWCRKEEPRQYFIGDVLHREKEHRKVSWDELFMDLLYVAVFSRLGYTLKVPIISWELFEEYCLTFIVCWV